MKSRTQDGSFPDALLIMSGLALLTAVSVAHSNNLPASAPPGPPPAVPASRMFVKHSHAAGAGPSLTQNLQATSANRS